jgi:hypothetical protein
MDKKSKEKSQYECEFKNDYISDWDIHRSYITDFNAYEAMLIGQVYDSVSNSVDGSKITDSYAATLAKERADRVVARLPEGETVPIGKADIGKAAFMDILRQKWIYPNANAQHPFLEKINMWQLYSSVYGYMPMFYDWNVSSTGYIGPDCWLWNPRNLVPQQGRNSIEDMDYVTALTWVGRKYLEDILDDLGELKNYKENSTKNMDSDEYSNESSNENSSESSDENSDEYSNGEETKAKKEEDLLETSGWNVDAIKELLEQDARQQFDFEKDTEVARLRTPQSTKKGICLATRYEAGEDGEWVTFAPDNGFIEVRRLKNPHKNGRIPFVIKYSQPLFDSFYGLGDFQRAKPLQYARDGLTNFYFKGIKMNLIPPIVVNSNGVLKHSIDYREGAVMQETIPNSIRRLETSTAGLATFQGAQSNLTGSLLSLFGSQNASLPGSETLNPSQGKTPSAINMYSEKEATRDGSDRRHLQSALEQLMDGFFSLIVNIGTESIPVSLFADDIEDIVKAGLEDVLGLFDGTFKPNENLNAGDLKIDPTKLKGVEYRFNMKADSTMQVSQQNQREALENFIGVIGKFQNLFKDDPRIKINWPAILEAEQQLSNLEGVKEFITVENGPSPQEQQMQAENEQLQQQMMQMQQEQQAAQQPQGPIVAKTGQMFNDPDLAQVADAVQNL